VETDVATLPPELSAKAIAALSPRKARYRIAPLLYVDKSKAPGSWLLMYVSPIRHRRVVMGMGSVGTVPLRQVKLEAAEYRLQIARGRCPLSERQEARAAHAAGRPQQSGKREIRTFEDAAEAYIAMHGPTWTSARHRRQWEGTLTKYVYPKIGKTPIGRIEVNDVLAILEPIWLQKPTTANRVRIRIETVFDYSKARKIFRGPNPAEWKGNLEALLPHPAKVRKLQHRAAMDWRELPSFYQRLAVDRDLSSLALRYLILTALRTGGVRLAEWREIDRANRVHVVPDAPGRKLQEPLRIPLSDEALAVLDAAKARSTGDFVFAGKGVNKPIGETTMLTKLHALEPTLTTHGFRASLRDWADERGVEHLVAERCLGHRIGNHVQVAYLRNDAFERRAAVLADWARFLTTPAQRVVVQIGRSC
jgi:integrase